MKTAELARLRELLDDAPGMICRFRADGEILFANRAYALSTGVAAAALEGRNLWSLVAAEDRLAVEAMLATLRPEHPEVAIENRFETASGPRWTLWQNRALAFDAEGRWTEAQSIGIDVSDRKRAEEELDVSQRALRDAHDSFHRLVQDCPFGIYAVDADFRLMIVSAGAQKVFENVSPQIGRDFAEVLHVIWPEPFASEAIGRFRHALETGESFHAPSTIEQRQDSGNLEAYDWKIERTTLPDGRLGVVCHFYDLSERKLFEVRLAESESRLRQALEAADAGAWESWPATGAFIASERALALHGLTSDAAVTHDLALAVLHDDDRPKLEQAIETSLRDGSPFSLELRIPQPDGSMRWIESRAAPVGEPAKLIGIAQDITARKQAEARQSLLVDELTHRVKNTLALVQGIAQQSFKGHAIPTEVRRNFEERLGALASAHDTLTRTKWTGSPLEEVLRQSIAFCGVKKSRFNLAGPEIQISANQTIPIAMIVHELCTNALKYGALSNEAGHIDLTWTVDGARTLLQLRWVERDGPAVKAPSRRGFGSQMIERAVAHQLRGSAQLNFEASGVTCILEAPLEPNEGEQ